MKPLSLEMEFKILVIGMLAQILGAIVLKYTHSEEVSQILDHAQAWIEKAVDA